MNGLSVPMALVDFLPVIFFAVAAVILMRDLYQSMCKGAYAIFSAGLIDVIMAGLLKALWKLLYAVGVCDFEPLNKLFFPLQSIGFLLAGLGILGMILFRQKNETLRSVAPPLYSGTFLFVGLMVAGLAMVDVGLCLISKKLKKPALIIIFILSFVCSLCMGYLSSRDFNKASMHWIAEGVNVCGQGLFLLGVILLHKAGLSEIELNKK